MGTVAAAGGLGPHGYRRKAEDSSGSESQDGKRVELGASTCAHW